jgi:GTPase
MPSPRPSRPTNAPPRQRKPSSPRPPSPRPTPKSSGPGKRAPKPKAPPSERGRRATPDRARTVKASGPSIKKAPVIKAKPGTGESRFGAIGVFGRANAGKSTLVNALVGETVSIVSARPQTTRRRIMGVLTLGQDQIVFCDTPGLHEVRNRLDAFMMGEIQATITGLQAGLFLVDGTDPNTEADAAYLKDLVPAAGLPLLLVINKIDQIGPAQARQLATTYATLHPFDGQFAVSARTGKGLEGLLEVVRAHLAAGPHAYGSDLYTTQTEREIAAEVIRGIILETYYHEVPHSATVQIEEFKERETGKTFIHADIYLERDSHKKILIGADGSGIKTLGTIARERLNEQLGRDIYLELWVKVRPGWRKDEEWVRRLGYRVGS